MGNRWGWSLSILIEAWMIAGRGGGTTVAEVDDLETMRCGTGDLVFPSPYLNQLSRGRDEG